MKPYSEQFRDQMTEIIRNAPIDELERIFKREGISELNPDRSASAAATETPAEAPTEAPTEAPAYSVDKHLTRRKLAETLSVHLTRLISPDGDEMYEIAHSLIREVSPYANPEWAGGEGWHDSMTDESDSQLEKADQLQVTLAMIRKQLSDEYWTARNKVPYNAYDEAARLMFITIYEKVIEGFEEIMSARHPEITGHLLPEDDNDD